MKESLHFGRFFTTLIVGIILIVVYKTFDNLSYLLNSLFSFLKLLAPFISGFLIAYLLGFPVKNLQTFFQKNRYLKRISKGLSILIVYVLIILLISISVKLIIPMVAKNVSEFVKYIPTYYQNLLSYLQQLPEESWLRILKLDDFLLSFSYDKISDYFTFDNILLYAQNIYGIITSAFSILVSLIVSLYCLLYIDNIKTFAKRFIRVIWGTKAEKNITSYTRKSADIFLKFIYSTLLDAILIGICATFILMILNVKYAGLLGLLLGIFNVIPYFGSIFASIFAIVVSLLTGGFYQALFVGISLLILQQIDANILIPRIIGETLNLNPILTIIAIILGGSWFGIIGMFLSIPVTAFFKLILLEYLDYKETVKVK